MQAKDFFDNLLVLGTCLALVGAIAGLERAWYHWRARRRFERICRRVLED